MWFGSVVLSEIRCDEVLAEIEHYIHGELDSIRAAVLADHLGECDTCLDHSEFQRRLREIVRAKCRLDTPSHLLFRVREAIRLERFERGQR